MARRSQEMHELVGAYALDALEPDEAEAFELHLPDCPKCRAELRDHRETAAMLAHAGAAAPDGVWDRIATELGDTPVGEHAILSFGRATGLFSPAQRRRFVLAAAAVAAAIIGFNSAVLVQQRNQIAELKPTAAASLRALADRALADPRSRTAILRRPDGTVAADAVVTADGRGYLLRPRLAALDSDHAYQLWGLSAAGRPVSLGVLGSQSTIDSFTARLAIAELAITVENAGGALAPSGAPLVRGALQRA